MIVDLEKKKVYAWLLREKEIDSFWRRFERLVECAEKGKFLIEEECIKAINKGGRTKEMTT